MQSSRAVRRLFGTGSHRRFGTGMSHQLGLQPIDLTGLTGDSRPVDDENTLKYRERSFAGFANSLTSHYVFCRRNCLSSSTEMHLVKNDCPKKRPNCHKVSKAMTCHATLPAIQTEALPEVVEVGVQRKVNTNCKEDAKGTRFCCLGSISCTNKGHLQIGLSPLPGQPLLAGKR